MVMMNRRYLPAVVADLTIAKVGERSKRFLKLGLTGI